MVGAGRRVRIRARDLGRLGRVCPIKRVLKNKWRSMIKDSKIFIETWP